MPNDIDNAATDGSMTPQGGEPKTGGEVLEALKEGFTALQESMQQAQQQQVEALAQIVQNLVSTQSPAPAAPTQVQAETELPVDEINWQNPRPYFQALVKAELEKLKKEVLQPLQQMVGGLSAKEQHRDLIDQFPETKGLPVNQVMWAFGEVFKTKPPPNADFVKLVREKLEPFVPKQQEPKKESEEETGAPATPSAAAFKLPPEVAEVEPVTDTPQTILEGHPALQRMKPTK